MPTVDPSVAAYIAAAAPLAQSILIELPERIHRSGPEVVEPIPWRAPAFDHHGLLAGFAAFPQYCSFALWQEKALVAESAEARA